MNLIGRHDGGMGTLKTACSTRGTRALRPSAPRFSINGSSRAVSSWGGILALRLPAVVSAREWLPGGVRPRARLHLRNAAAPGCSPKRRRRSTSGHIRRASHELADPRHDPFASPLAFRGGLSGGPNPPTATRAGVAIRELGPGGYGRGSRRTGTRARKAGVLESGVGASTRRETICRPDARPGRYRRRRHRPPAIHHEIRRLRAALQGPQRVGFRHAHALERGDAEMMPDDPMAEPELKSFLRPLGTRRRAPAAVRQRALAHARVIAAAGGAVPKSPRTAPPVARGHRLLRLALACSVLAVGGVAAFAAFRGRAVPEPELAPPGDPQPTPAVQAQPAAPVQEAPTSPTQVPPRASSGRDVLAAEIALLRRARGAYDRREFSRALVLVDEHARRFPQGHLAEEREALRVRSLSSLGRTAEAHRVAAAFALRFPRSVLLPRATEKPDAPK
jgi:hypothetical protein